MVASLRPQVGRSAPPEAASADLSRRRFLTRASLGVAAGLAASSGLALPQLLGAAAAAPEAAPIVPDLAPLGEDLVVLVRNASSGEVALMSGMGEVVIKDQQLVGRLLTAARSIVGKE